MYQDWIMARLPKDIPEDVIAYVSKEIDNNFADISLGSSFGITVNGAVQTSWNIRQWMKTSSSYGYLRETLSTSL